jgi:two-component system, NtrC family, sensor histidine kinase GlrK
MRFLRPRSLTGLMLIGFSLVAVPLLLAVLNAAAKVRSLSDESAALVRNGVQTTHYAQQLFQQISAMERSARLYQVLNDPELLSVYREARGRFLKTVADLGILESNPGRDVHLQHLRAVHQKIDSTLLAVPLPQGEPLHETLTQFEQLSDAAGKLSGYTSDQIDRGLSGLQKRTVETQGYLFWQSAGLIVITAMLIGLFTSLLMRPIRQIDQAISQLGKGTFSRAITVRGPLDLVALGQQLEWALGVGSRTQPLLAPHVA